MAVQTRVSLHNHCSLATIHYATTHQAAWPATNAKYPQQPFIPAISTVGAGVTSDIGFDFLAPQSIEIIALINVNYTQASIALDDASGFSSPDYSATVSPTRNPWNRRYSVFHVLSPPRVFRYLLVRASSTSVITDGAATYSTGGVWAGALTALPSDIRWDERPRTVEPHLDVPLIGGGSSRVSTGRPYVELRAARLALTLIDTPGTGDELGGWLEVDRLMSDARPFAWYFNRGNTSEGFIVRKMNDSNWNVNQILSDDELILHEAVGP